MVTEIFDGEKKRQIARDILSKLLDWFGLPESTKRYIEESAKMPFWAWEESEKSGGVQEKGTEDSIVLGFLALKETSPDTAEIFVMGVLPGQHRRGIGRELYLAFE